MQTHMQKCEKSCKEMQTLEDMKEFKRYEKAFETEEKNKNAVR